MTLIIVLALLIVALSAALLAHPSGSVERFFGGLIMLAGLTIFGKTLAVVVGL